VVGHGRAVPFVLCRDVVTVAIEIGPYLDAFADNSFYRKAAAVD
jgi:hypothetical protein